MRNTFIQEIETLAAQDESIYVISGDAGFGVFERYKETRPNRFINAGIAEANTIGYGAGLAMMGFNVFVYNIIPFVLYRCYEQVRNDICYQRLPVTLIGIGSGVTYAPGGMTHYSVEDLAICLSLPNLTVISPSDPVETRAAIRYAHTAKEPVYIRLAKSGEPVLGPDTCEDILTPRMIGDGEEVAVIGYGSIMKEAVDAAMVLKEEGICPRVISVPTIQPFPADQLLKQLDGCHTVCILEEHFRSGGLATRFFDRLSQKMPGIEILSWSIPDHYIHAINTQNSIRSAYGLDAAAIAAKVRSYAMRRKNHAI